MSELIVVKVIQDDINKASKRRREWKRLYPSGPFYNPYKHCPIACALDRMGLSFIEVGKSGIRWNRFDMAVMPDKARAFISRFDREMLSEVEEDFDFAVRGPEVENGQTEMVR